MLSYIVFDKSLFTALKIETNLAYHDNQLDIPHLLTKCPLLESTYMEVMRLVNGALSARKIVAPTRIGGKILDSGNTILIPIRQLHHSTKAFGDNPAHFNPERFLRDKSLSNSSYFRPFGGGANYCPGRFLAKQEMLVFTALMLTRFDISLSEGVPQPFPELDMATPALGVNGHTKGTDVLIDLKEAT